MISSTQLTVTSAAVNILGTGSTVLRSGGASAYRPLRMSLLNLASTRSWINPTSAGTTANSYVLNGVNGLITDIFRSDQWWIFTSAGADARVLVLGGLQ